MTASSRVFGQPYPPIAGDILETVRRIAIDVAAAHSSDVDAEARWPHETLSAMQEAGLGGLTVPADAGGLGLGLGGLAAVCEVLAGECASSAICFGMHCVGAAVIAAKATDDQRRRYLEPIAQGRHLTTLALSERGTGAHFYLPQTTFSPGDDATFLIDGGKTFVTNGGHADSYVISTVAASPESPPGRFSCLVADASADGLEWGSSWSGLGMRGNDSRALTLDGVAVPRSNLLGREGDEIWYVFNVVAPYFLMAMAGTYLGVAHAALTGARDHLMRRAYAASGTTLAASPVLQHRLGTLWATYARTRAFVFDVAARGDAGDPDALPGILSAKAEVADASVAIANEAMTLAGGIAYGENDRLSRCLRDARAAHVMAPTTDMLRTWTGRIVLGQPLLSE